MTVGTIVKLKAACLALKPGTLGVGFNDYSDIGDGCQFIFENGNYDGFSFDEQFLFLEVVGFAEELKDYKFVNVMRVSDDFRKGIFNKALKIK